MKTIWFICVNYCATEDTIKFITQLENHLISRPLKIIVVDNSPMSDDILFEYALSKKGVYLIASGKNLGYLPGANYGYTWAAQQWDLPDLVVVSNVDLIFDGSELLSSIEKLTYDKTIGVYAPKIVSLITGRDQNPYMVDRPKRSLYKFHSLIYSSLFGYLLVSLTWKVRNILKSFFKANLNNHIQSLSPGRIYAPHGSFMLFTKMYFESSGNLDFKSFLFGEEIYVAETLRRINLQIEYIPEIKIIHDEHKSTSMVGLIRRAAFTKQSSSYLMGEFFK
jgi:GT2 family glycosyltransferase